MSEGLGLGLWLWLLVFENDLKLNMFVNGYETF